MKENYTVTVDINASFTENGVEAGGYVKTGWKYYSITSVDSSSVLTTEYVGFFKNCWMNIRFFPWIKMIKNTLKIFDACLNIFISYLIFIPLFPCTMIVGWIADIWLGLGITPIKKQAKIVLEAWKQHVQGNIKLLKEKNG